MWHNFATLHARRNTQTVNAEYNEGLHAISREATQGNKLGAAGAPQCGAASGLRGAEGMKFEI